SSSSAILAPFLYAQSKNLSASPEAAMSCAVVCIRMKLAAVIGQESAPGCEVRMTPYPGTDFQSAFAAAAWKDFVSGATLLPSLLTMLAWVSLFCLA